MVTKDLYNYNKQILNCQTNLSNSTISQRNKEIIENYVRDNRLKAKLEPPTIIKYYGTLTQIARDYITKDFDKMTKEDFEILVEKLDNKNNSITNEPISEGTKEKFRAILKKFGNWLVNGDKVFNGMKHTYPQSVDWITVSLKSKLKNKISSGDICTIEEVDSLIKACNNSRDSALISGLYETGSRVSEFGNIKLKNIIPFEHGYKIKLALGK